MTKTCKQKAVMDGRVSPTSSSYELTVFPEKTTTTEEQHALPGTADDQCSVFIRTSLEPATNDSKTKKIIKRNDVSMQRS